MLTPPKINRNTYLWRDGNGAPRGYLIYDNQDKGVGAEFEVNTRFREWAALDHDARLGIFRFLRDHDSQIKEITMRTPPDVPVIPYLNNPRCEYKISAGFMARIVDVKQAFEAKSYPKGLAGQVRFRVKDDYCTWNNDTFTLKIEDRKATVSTGVSEVDFLTDICTLAAIFTGFWTLREAFEYRKIKGISREDVERFGPLFIERTPYLINFF